MFQNVSIEVIEKPIKIEVKYKRFLGENHCENCGHLASDQADCPPPIQKLMITFSSLYSFGSTGVLYQDDTLSFESASVTSAIFIPESRLIRYLRVLTVILVRGTPVPHHHLTWLICAETDVGWEDLSDTTSHVTRN